MADNKTVYEISVEGGAAESLRKIAESAKSVSDSVSKGFKGAADSFSVFKGALASEAVVGAFKAMASAISGTFQAAVTDGIKAAQEQEDALNQLNISLASTGQFSKSTSKAMEDFASQMQATTRFADDQVLSAASLIQTFARLDKDGLQRATRAAADLAARFNIDLETAARAVGRAADGSAEELKKFGIVVKNGADASTTFANAVKAINTQLGGSAEAQVNTFSGSVTQLSNNFGELQEAVGFAFTQNKVLLTVFQAANETLVKFGAYLTENKDSLNAFVSEGVIFAIESLQVFVSVVDAVGRISTGVFRAIETGILAVAFAGATAASLFDDSWAATAENIKVLMTESAASIDKAFTEDTNLDAIGNSLATLQAKAQEAFAASGESAIVYSNSISQVTVLTKEQEAAIESLRTKYNELSAQLVLNSGTDLQNLAAKYAKEKELAGGAFLAGVTDRQNYLATVSRLDKKYDNDKKKLEEDAAKREAALNQQKLTATGQIFGNISSLAKEAGRDGFEIAKAASLAQASVLGVQAVLQALASAPPPFNFILAATVGAVAAVNVAKIASSSPPSYANGIDSIPPGFERDNFPAFLQSGERVVPRESNKKLTSFLEGDSPMVGLLASIDNKLSALANQTIEIDGKEVFTVVRNYREAGYAF